eukprot:symbB.v1.2.019564.t1/scaffold1600.1/size109688/7
MVERLQQSCLSEANLGKTSCIWEETLPGGSGVRKGFSALVAQALASQVTRVGFSSVEWWGGKDFKNTGGEYLLNPIPMYGKYAVKLRVRWENEVPLPRETLTSSQRRSSRPGEGPIVAMMKEVKDVLELQQQLVSVSKAQASAAKREAEQCRLRAELAERLGSSRGFAGLLTTGMTMEKRE